jgi:hypothetical protein
VNPRGFVSTLGQRQNMKFGAGAAFCRLLLPSFKNGNTMQYMLMCCFDETAWNNLPDAQKDKIMRDYGDWVQNLANTGHFRGGAKLYPAPSARTVRMKNGKVVFTDGPFAETKEQLGGYHLIDCMDLNEAMSIAVRVPTLPAGGTVEVRCIEASSAELP